MSWVRIDDQFPDHPKVLTAGPHAAWLFVCSLAYAARYLTDGFIPAEQVRRLATVKSPEALAKRLVEAGLWEAAEGGFQVHDYLEYNPSAERVRETRATRAKAGQTGGLHSGESRRVPDIYMEGTTKQIASPLLHTNLNPGPARPDPVHIPTGYNRPPEWGAAEAHAARRSAAPRKIDDEFVTELVTEFGPKLGGEHLARDAIAKARAYLGGPGWNRSRLRKWLEGDAEMVKLRGSGNGQHDGRGPTEDSVEAFMRSWGKA